MLHAVKKTLLSFIHRPKDASLEAIWNVLGILLPLSFLFLFFISFLSLAFISHCSSLKKDLKRSHTHLQSPSLNLYFYPPHPLITFKMAGSDR